MSRPPPLSQCQLSKIERATPVTQRNDEALVELQPRARTTDAPRALGWSFGDGVPPNGAPVVVFAHVLMETMHFEQTSRNKHRATNTTQRRSRSLLDPIPAGKFASPDRRAGLWTPITNFTTATAREVAASVVSASLALAGTVPQPEHHPGRRPPRSRCPSAQRCVPHGRPLFRRTERRLFLHPL